MTHSNRNITHFVTRLPHVGPMSHYKLKLIAMLYYYYFYV